MAECNESPTGKHEPWIYPGNPRVGEKPRPYDVSGLLKPPAFVCKHCQLVYVERATMEAYLRSAERVARGEATTFRDKIAEAMRDNGLLPKKRKTDP